MQKHTRRDVRLALPASTKTEKQVWFTEVLKDKDYAAKKNHMGEIHCKLKVKFGWG